MTVFFHMHACMQELSINMSHIESRPSKTNPGKEYDFYVDYICSEEKRAELVTKLKEYTTSINLLSRSPQQDEGSNWWKDVKFKKLFFL